MRGKRTDTNKQYNQAAQKQHELPMSPACILGVLRLRRHPGYSLSPSPPAEWTWAVSAHQATAVATTYGQDKCSCLSCGDPPFIPLWNTLRERRPCENVPDKAGLTLDGKQCPSGKSF